MRLVRLALAAAALAALARVVLDPRMRAELAGALGEGRGWAREARAELVDDLAAARGAQSA